MGRGNEARAQVMIRIRQKPESITDAVRSSHNYLYAIAALHGPAR